MIGSAAALLQDPGVLAPEPCCSWNHATAAALTGGVAVLPWRADHLAAVAAGIATCPEPPSAADWGQAVVHARKQRAGTWADCAAAWSRLRPGGRLLVAGHNEVGIATTLRRLARELGQAPELLANRRRCRLGLFHRDHGPGPVAPVSEAVIVDAWRYATAAGCFAAGAVDPGSALLLQHLDALGHPEAIADLGAGCGLLGIAAARRFPAARVVLAEADATALVCARDNARAAGCDARVTTRWWDAHADPAPCGPVDAIVCNPPWHTGKAVDLSPAEGMFATIAGCLAAGGRALVVANTRLPYESRLAGIGTCTGLATAPGYKLLLLVR